MIVNTARVDALFSFTDSSCTAIQGSFTLRFFEGGEDPLVPATDTGESVTDTFEGRKVTPQSQMRGVCDNSPPPPAACAGLRKPFRAGVQQNRL